MNLDSQTFVANALKLPRDVRAEIVTQLLESLDTDQDQGVAEAWDEEIRTRVEEVRSGTVTPVPWAEARRQILEDIDDDAH